MMAKLSETKSLIRELADLLKETDLNEIEVEDDDFRIRVARSGVSVESPAPGGQAAVAGPTSPALKEEEAPAKQAAELPPSEGQIEEEDHAGAVTSPMVGTAYVAAEPGADPFIKLGDSVTEGQTLLIIEAMKVMNPIPAPSAGTITKIFFEDGQPIEFGQPLVIIE